LIAKLLKLGFAGLASLLIGFAFSQHYNALYGAKPITSEFELTRKTRPVEVGKLSRDLMGKLLDPSLGSVEEIECRKKLITRGIVRESHPCFDLDKALADLGEGVYSYLRPFERVVDATFTVTLSLTDVALESFPSAAAKDKSTASKDKLVAIKSRYAQNIEATLMGADLKIEPSGPQQKTATSAAPVNWTWFVTPQKTGIKDFTIEVAANIVQDADISRVQLMVLRDKVEIRMTMIQYVKAAIAEVNGFVLALTAALTTLIALFGAVGPLRQWLFGLFQRPNSQA